MKPLLRFNAIYKRKYDLPYNVRVMAESVEDVYQKLQSNNFGKPVQVLRVYGTDSGNYVAIIP